MRMSSTTISGAETTSEYETDPIVRPIRTDSPRDTLATFLWLRSELEDALADYTQRRTSDGFRRIPLLGQKLRALLDLEEVGLSELLVPVAREQHPELAQGAEPQLVEEHCPPEQPLHRRHHDEAARRDDQGEVLVQV